MQINNLLLDTHAWIWLMNGDGSLSKKAREMISDAHENGNLFVAAISCWEVGMLEKKARIILSKPCIEWIKTSQHFGIRVASLTAEIATESSHLPGHFHGDPADRMIIATARIESLTIITRDEQMLAYAKQKLVGAVKA